MDTRTSPIRMRLARMHPARRALVQTALTYLENLQADAAGDPGLSKELAAAYAKVGRVQGHPLAANLGDPAAALQSYRGIVLMAATSPVLSGIATVRWRLSDGAVTVMPPDPATANVVEIVKSNAKRTRT